ncbi:hypothetical protein DFH08DRAFT_613003, partial [Mycena albidolilacea]
IPRMRFVGIAFATEGKSSERSVFLVEEQIEESREGQFRKYINNRAPIPTTFVSDSENGTRASFLTFTQHWQFKRTHGLAFDIEMLFAGGDTLLTDPQIMSDPSLGDIFALGNIPSECKDFPNTHLCNVFCEYF